MNIIAWDKENGSPVEPQRPPQDGEWCRVDSGGFVEIKMWYEPQEPAPLLPITVTAITGDLMHNATFTKVDCYEDTNVTVSGTLEVPDQMFRMPVARQGGDDLIFFVEVKDGAFNAVLNFPASGIYHYTNAQANAGLPEPLFNIEAVRFAVGRQTGV